MIFLLGFLPKIQYIQSYYLYMKNFLFTVIFNFNNDLGAIQEYYSSSRV